MAPTSSSIEIQLMYWRPEAMRPPSPRRNGSSKRETHRLAAEHDAAADASTRIPALPLVRSPLPIARTRGRRSRCRCALLVERLVTAVAVVPIADAETRVDGGCCQSRERSARRSVPFGALEDQAFARVRPPLVADAGAGEVDDAADALQAVGVDRARLGVPGELVVTGGPASNDANRAMTLAGERGQERRPDETVRAGDRDIHADSMQVSSAPSSTG